MPALKPKVRADLEVVDIEGEAVIYDPADVLLHYLNPTAALVFKLCDGSGTVRELSEDIAEVLGLPQDGVLRQVRRVVSQFKQAGLIDGIPRKVPVHAHTHAHSGDGHHHDRPGEAEEATDGRGA